MVNSIQANKETTEDTEQVNFIPFVDEAETDITKIIKTLSTVKVQNRALCILNEVATCLKEHNQDYVYSISEQGAVVLFKKDIEYANTLSLDRSDPVYIQKQIELSNSENFLRNCHRLYNNGITRYVISEEDLKSLNLDLSNFNFLGNETSIQKILLVMTSYQTQMKKIRVLLNDKTQNWWKRTLSNDTPLVSYIAKVPTKYTYYNILHTKKLVSSNRVLSNMVIICGLRYLLNTDPEKYKELKPIYDFYNTVANISGIRKIITYKEK